MAADSFASAESHWGYRGVVLPQVGYQRDHLAFVRDILKSYKCTTVKVATDRLDGPGTVEANDWGYLNAHAIQDCLHRYLVH